MSDLLTTDEMAARLRVSRQAVLNWYHAGVIPAEVAVRKVYRFNPERVEEALRRAAEEAAGTAEVKKAKAKNKMLVI